VRQPDGSVRTNTLHVKRSAHGPVVSERRQGTRAARGRLDQPHLGEQYLDMIRASSGWTRSRRPSVRLQMPMFHDDVRRPCGEYPAPVGGPRRCVLQATTGGRVSCPEACLRRCGGETHPYDQLPRVVNPPSGWLQNANDPPWTTTFRWRSTRRSTPTTWRHGHELARSARHACWTRIERDVRRARRPTNNSTRMELADRLLDESPPGGREARRRRRGAP